MSYFRNDETFKQLNEAWEKMNERRDIELPSMYIKTNVNGSSMNENDIVDSRINAINDIITNVLGKYPSVKYDLGDRNDLRIFIRIFRGASSWYRLFPYEDKVSVSLFSMYKTKEVGLFTLEELPSVVEKIGKEIAAAQ